MRTGCKPGCYQPRLPVTATDENRDCFHKLAVSFQLDKDGGGWVFLYRSARAAGRRRLSALLMEKITSKRALYFVPGRSRGMKGRDGQADEKVKGKFQGSAQIYRCSRLHAGAYRRAPAPRPHLTSPPPLTDQMKCRRQETLKCSRQLTADYI